MLGHGYTDKPGTRSRSSTTSRTCSASSTRSASSARTCRASRSAAGSAARAAIDHPERVDRLVLNTAGGSQAEPEVMERIRTLSMAAAERPDWETVQRRIVWLMADKSRDYDDIVASRQAIYRSPASTARCTTSWRCRTPRCAPATCVSAEEYGADQAPTLVLWTERGPHRRRRPRAAASPSMIPARSSS